MRWLLFALLLGAVLQSWGQKFPKMVGPLPNLAKELPGPGQCPKLPPCFFEQQGIDKTFPNYGKALMWFTMHWYCESTIWCSMSPETPWFDDQPVRVKGNSIGEAICDLIRQRPMYWIIKRGEHVWIIAGRPTPFTAFEAPAQASDWFILPPHCSPFSQPDAQ